ncbi:MAG: C40 family peptidase [Blautia sp.]|nr:C40 family peptidase [Blautia sp.]
MAKKMNFRNDMKEAKAPEVNVEETERLPTEKGYTRTKRKLKGTKNNEQTLRHGKKPIEKKQSGKLKSAIVSQQLHRKIAEADEDDNIGVESVNRGVQAAEAGADVARGTVQKVKKYGNKLHDRAVKPEVSAKKETLRYVEEEFTEGVKNAEAAKATGTAAEPAGKSNPLSRFMQRKSIKQDYAAAKAGRAVTNPAAYGHAVKPPLKERVSQVFSRAGEFVKSHAGVIAIGGAFIFLLVFMFTQLSSCSSMAGGSGGTLLGSSYTAEDADIIGANEDYKALEAELRSEIDNIESTHPGYDEYRYNLAEINHNPYVLTSYLTVKYEDYTRAEVQSELQALFDKQYELELEEEVEIRTRTETRTGTTSYTDPETGETTEEEYEYEVEVKYEYYILNVTLKNKTLEAAIFDSGMTDDERERYMVLNETMGNRPYLFEGDVYANVTPTLEYLDYDIPGEALSDVRFARMIQEAEKYLGYPYVWGGSSPSTSFDCSGFVCWVINHCGNGWNYGRTTAEGLRQQLSIIPRSEAKPGDIIFFQGTYNTSGASHVAIYVGDGMMIHCGNPIQYASINSSYWQAHFYCFGRLP